MSLIADVTLPAAYELEELGDVGCLRDIAIEKASAGAEEGTLLVAHALETATGYQSKSWQGFAENFHATLVLEPECDASRFHEMAILGVTSLGSSIATHVAPMTSLTYKWPNDIYIADQKVASVWLDKGTSERGPWITVTASVNLVHAPGDDSGDFSLPTMSLREAEGNSDITVPVLLETWARQFIAQINDWDRRGFAHILAYWQVRSEPKEFNDIVLADGSAVTGMQQQVHDDASITIQDNQRGPIRISLPQYMRWD